MRWRSARCSPHLRTKSNFLSPSAGFRQRYSSGRGGLSISNPSIASVLALRPKSEGEQSQRITVAGFVRTIRNQKLRSFLEVGDGSTVYPLQAVLPPIHAKGLGTGAAVLISGRWQPAPPGKEQSYELNVDDLRILGPTDSEVSAAVYPIQKKFHTPEYLRTIPHLRLRTPLNALLARVRSECDFHVSKFFHGHEFVRLQPPILTSSDCEGAGEVFSVSADSSASNLHDIENSSENGRAFFFRAPKFLTVSSQLHLEAFVHEHQKVWSLSPTFRAEKSDTPRHLSEFWMLEVEFQTETLQDVIDLAENVIRSLVIDLQESSIFDEITSIQKIGPSTGVTDPIRRRWDGLISQSWPRISYNEAIQRLISAVDSKQTSFKIAPSWNKGLQPEHERLIAKEVGRGSPVFVTDYPQAIKPFYMLPSGTGEDPATAACFDLLLPDICEVVGGSLREHRAQNLVDSMHRHGLKTSTQPENSRKGHAYEARSPNDSASLDWYVDLRRFGSVPHGGFGLGLDRLISYLTGVNNLKDVAPWPRWYGRCDC